MIKKVVVQIDDFDVNKETAFLVDISKEVGGINTVSYTHLTLPTIYSV